MIEAQLTIEPQQDENMLSSMFFRESFTFFSNQVISDFIKPNDVAITLCCFIDKLVVIFLSLFHLIELKN